MVANLVVVFGVILGIGEGIESDLGGVSLVCCCGVSFVFECLWCCMCMGVVRCLFGQRGLSGCFSFCFDRCVSCSLS